ncbi:unnamed protein product [Camellia sinensis]
MKKQIKFDTAKSAYQIDLKTEKEVQNSEFGEVNLILAGQRGGSQIMKKGFIILYLSFHPYLSSTPQIRYVFFFYDQSSLGSACH